MSAAVVVIVVGLESESGIPSNTGAGAGAGAGTITVGSMGRVLIRGRSIHNRKNLKQQTEIVIIRPFDAEPVAAKMVQIYVSSWKG